MDVFQQFAGPLSEIIHTTNKLIIVKDEGSRRANGNILGGTGVGSVLGGAAANLGGVGGIVSAAQHFAIKGKKFELQINPEKYERNYAIKYTTPEPVNGVRQRPQFRRVGQGKLNLTFTLDGTGIIPASVTDPINFAVQTGAKLLGATDASYVTRRIKELKETIGDYQTSDHEPPLVKIIWGDETPFKGRMEDLKVTYTLFHPSGVPLRAEIVVNFTEFSDINDLPQSPDLTHQRKINDYDRLPLLTEEIYYDAAYSWQVAQANNLTHYRRLKTGTEISFPPLERRFLKS